MTMEEIDSDEDYDPNNDKWIDGKRGISYRDLRQSGHATVSN